MDLFGLLGYVNKFSLMAFIATLGVLVYQVYQLKNDSKLKHETPVIPDFNDKASVPSINYSPVSTKIETHKSGGLNINLILLIVLTVGIGLFLIISIFMRASNQQESTQIKEPIIKITASKGIKMYDSDWVELNEDKISKLKSGEKVFVGIDRTDNKEIDKARIRINQTVWNPDDENLEFSSEKNIFYKNHTVSSEEAFLRVEAQLHHINDGWLGE